MRLLLLDGYSLFNRAFHALPPFTTRDGQPTNAILGFFNTFNKLIDDLHPDAALVALDRPGGTFRHQVYQDYKGTRSEADPTLIAQIPLFLETLVALDIPHLGLDGYEADDIMGTLAKRAAADGVDVVIVSGDRDLLQLVGPQVKVMLSRSRGEFVLLDEAGVREFMGVDPARITDLKALTGDSSDNIPGVRGIGDKTALALLAGGQDLDRLLADPDGIPAGRARELLLADQEMARLSKQLATIVTDLPLDLELTGMAYEPHLNAAGRAVLERLELRSLITKLAGGTAKTPTANAAPPVPRSALPRPEVKVAAGTEVSVVVDGDQVAVCDQSGGRMISVAEAAAWWHELPGVVMHDAKPTMHLLAERGVTLPHLAMDTALAAYLRDSSHGRYPLERVAQDVLGETVTDGDLVGQAQVVRQLAPTLLAEIDRMGLRQLMDQVEMPLLGVLFGMERSGIRVDADALQQLSSEMERSLAKLTDAITQLAGYAFNINSTQQLGQVLFDKLGLPVLRRNKTGPSTDADVLEQLAPMHEIVGMILEHRTLQKLKSTYTDGLPPYIRPDGRIHATFGQMVAATGRISCSEPNLQNIPIRLEAGRRLRRAFLPSRPDWQLLAVDYSQIELRLLAHFAADDALMAAFQSGRDIHTETAAEVFAVSADQVTPELRRQAKAVNFGIIYGISDFGLARDLGVDVATAHQVIERYFSRFPAIRAYLEQTVESARQTGYATTILGRRRPLPDIRAKNANLRKFAERTAMNTPLQGSAADILKVAMVQVASGLASQKLGDRLLLTVHDELILEGSAAELAVMAPLVRRAMEQAVELKVPLAVEVKAGATWYDVQPIGSDA
ncbi:MAG: DNA polymerase I [Sulfobacillus sp.]